MISRSLSSVRAVAAVGVGMMALHQHLEARLDLGLVGADLEAELVHALRSALRMARWRLGLLAPLRPAPNSRNTSNGSRAASVPSSRRRPIAGPIFQVGRWPVMASFWYCGPHRRSCRRNNCRNGCTRARARGRSASIRSRAAAPSARDASPRCRSPATRSTAHRARGRRSSLGLDPDAVEQGRVEFHDRTLCGGGDDTFKS